MGNFENLASHGWLRRHRRRFAEIGTGHVLYASFSWVFDNILYVWIVYRFGLLGGGCIMTMLSLIVCAATLLLYERMRIDWVGAGSVARLAAVPHPSWWQLIIMWTAGRGDIFIFFALCIFQDPFITTAYFRRGHFDGLRAHDWQIFFASGLVANIYWTLRSGAVAAVFVGAWRWLNHQCL